LVLGHSTAGPLRKTAKRFAAILTLIPHPEKSSVIEMPKGPRGEKRPADVIGAAVKVMRIATGEEEDDREATASAAAQLGKLGGKARAKAMTPERRAEIAREAAAKRWGRRTQEP
jgi:hypothetical protein